MAPRRVFLDACALYPPLVRRVLVAAAERGLIAPLWSPRVLEEWARAAARNHDLHAERAVRAEAALLDARWPGASVAAEPDPATTLPDPDDAHVLASALAAGAELLATFNLRDFPAAKLCGLGVAPIHPDALLWELAGGAPEAVADAAGAALAAFPEALEREGGTRMLKRAGLPRLARLIRRDPALESRMEAAARAG